MPTVLLSNLSNHADSAADTLLRDFLPDAEPEATATDVRNNNQGRRQLDYGADAQKTHALLANTIWDNSG